MPCCSSSRGAEFFDVHVRMDWDRYPYLVLVGVLPLDMHGWLNKQDQGSYRYHVAYERVNEDPVAKTATLLNRGTAVMFSDPQRAMYAKLKWGQA